MKVAELNDRTDLQFISDSQDVAEVNDFISWRYGIPDKYDSFFVKVEDGEYLEIYGVEGIVPYLNKEVTKI